MKVVFDANGYAWYLNKKTGSIQLVGDTTKNAGYAAADWNEAVTVLNAHGYMDIPTKPKETDDAMNQQMEAIQKEQMESLGRGFKKLKEAWEDIYANRK